MGSHLVSGLDRAGSFVLVEEYLRDWIPFNIGSTIYIRLAIYLPAGPTFASELTAVSFATLTRAEMGVVELSLAGLSASSVGLRLIQPDVVDFAVVPPSFQLSILNVVAQNVMRTNLGPRLSFSCRASAAGQPNRTTIVAAASSNSNGNSTEIPISPLEGSVFAERELDVENWNVQTPLQAGVALWNAQAVGIVFVCSIVQKDSTRGGIYRQSDFGLGVISIDVRQFTSTSSSFALDFSPSNDAFAVTVFPCATCPRMSSLANIVSVATPLLVAALFLVMTIF